MSWVTNINPSEISTGKMNTDVIGIDYDLMEFMGPQAKEKHKIRIRTIKILRANQKCSSIAYSDAKMFVERFITG